MILDIKPVHQDGVNCFQDVICMVAHWKKREYEMAFKEGWTFVFKPEDLQFSGLLGNRINVEEINYQNILEKYCGMRMVRRDVASPAEALKLLEDELHAGRPTIIFQSTFWCPWHNDYQRIRHDHACLAIGFDGSGDILCYDQLLNDVCILPINDFSEGTKRLFTFEILETPLIDNYMDILRETIKKIVRSNMFTDIKKFSQEFMRSFDYSEEMKNIEVEAFDVLIHRNLGYIASGRKGFAKFLMHIYEKNHCQELLSKISQLNGAANRWSNMRSILVKSYYTGFGEEKKAKICSILDELSGTEENIARDLLRISEGYRLEEVLEAAPEEESIEELGDAREYFYLDLKGYFNNNSFSRTLSAHCKADLTGMGHYFLAQDPPVGALTVDGTMKFLIPEMLDDHNDNISCEQQVIVLPAHMSGNSFRSIQILGCGEWGNYLDAVGLQYEDGEITRVMAGFSDWSYPPMYGEVVAWKGTGVEKKGGKAQILGDTMKSISAKQYLFAPRKGLKSIALPYCSNAHIYAITLCS